jgi:hypothetical protein
MWKHAIDDEYYIGLSKICTFCLDLPDRVPSTTNKDRMKKLCHLEVDVSTTPIEAHKPFGVSSFGVRVLDV